jgi:hypothetical protein
MISRNDFLGLVLSPLKDGEHYCSWGNKKENDETRVRQQFAASIEELSAQADGLQAEGYNAFYGMAKYGPKDNGRYATNAISLKSFFLDLDCGPTKPYATLPEGLAALKNFCKATKLPKPTIVRSGHGAHVYWVLEEPLPRQEWKPYAERLKDLCEESTSSTLTAPFPPMQPVCCACLRPITSRTRPTQSRSRFFTLPLP